MFARKSVPAVAAHQSRIDAIVAAAREGSQPAPKRAQTVRAVRGIHERSAEIIDQRLEEELATIGRTLDSIGDRLSDDPILLNRYAALLQALDNAAQSLGHLALVVGAVDRLNTAHEVPVRELRARLLRGASAATPARLERSATNPFTHQ